MFSTISKKMTLKHFNIRDRKNVFLDEYPKVRHLKTPKSLKNIFFFKYICRKNSEWFSITTIDPTCFMMILWSISAHWCFQKVIGSGMAFKWSQTPQSRGSGNLGTNRKFNVRSKTFGVPDEILWKILTKFLPTYSRFPTIMWTLKPAYT